jgi:integrase
MNRKKPTQPASEPATLATVLSTLDQRKKLPPIRQRDLRSATRRVAELFGDTPSAIVLDMAAIAAKLAGISPPAVGLTPKRLANVRSDFVAAVRESGIKAVQSRPKGLSPAWIKLFSAMPRRRRDIGLSRLGRYATSRGIEPNSVNARVIDDFIAATRAQSLHRNPRALHRQTALIWNEAAGDPKLGLHEVAVPSFRGPPKRIEWAWLPESFRKDVDAFLSWAGKSDPFAADSRSRALAPRTVKLRRNQLHAAATALVDSGTTPAAIGSIADLLESGNFKSILRHRFELARGEVNTFNQQLGGILVSIARDWVKVDAARLAELKRMAGKLPSPPAGLTRKNKSFLRQFDEPKSLKRLVELPDRLWSEVKRDTRPNFRTLAKAQAALAIGILTYIPIRVGNLSSLTFDTHLFVRPGDSAVSTLELSDTEVKNRIPLAYDIPQHLAKKLIEYRERVAPKVVGHRPARLFVNADGTAKSHHTVSWLISTYLRRRAGLTMSAHQFRHLSAKVLLDAQPGAFEVVRQLLGHKRNSTTVNAYAGIDSRRAARHHQRMIENALASQMPTRSTRRRGT